MSRFEEVSPEKIKSIAWKFTKTVILLGLAGYELIITNSAYGLVGYIYQLISGASSKTVNQSEIGNAGKIGQEQIRKIRRVSNVHC